MVMVMAMTSQFWRPPSYFSNFHHLDATKIRIALGIGILIMTAVGTDAEAGRVNARERRQKARNEKGEASGQLTPKEVNRLERQQARIEQAEAKAKADGNLSPEEQLKLERMQDCASKNIRIQRQNGQGN